jgi:hypothetical protein
MNIVGSGRSQALLNTISGSNAASATTSISTALSAPTSGDLPAKTRHAAGALVDYMHANGLQILTLNDLAKLASNASGDVPPEVSSAAKFMLKNPDIFAAIETHDCPGRDGISGVSNFEFAAQGGLEKVAANATQGGTGMSKADAAGVLSDFMNDRGIKSVDSNALYQLAMNPSPDTPPNVSAAARTMLEHPGTFNRITGGTGSATAADFDNAAQGTMPGDASSGLTSPNVDAGASFVSQAINQTLAMLQAIQQINGGTQQQDSLGSDMNHAIQQLEQTLKLMAQSDTPRSDSAAS